MMTEGDGYRLPVSPCYRCVYHAAFNEKDYPLFCFIADIIIIITIKKYMKAKISNSLLNIRLKYGGIPGDGTWILSPKTIVLNS